MLDNLAEPSLDCRLLNDFQQNFPLCPAPFAELARGLGVAESVVLRMLEKLRREGKIARVGAVFAPKRIGSSTLAALSVPTEKLALVSEAINRFPEVNHNYVREHHYNLWFVVTAGSDGRLQAALGAIERAAGYPLLRLPLLKEYTAGHEGGVSVPAETYESPTVLDEIERRLVMALQEGLPFFIRPFSVLASRVGCDESEVLERIRRWCAEGVIKRFGVVVRQRTAGVGGSAMLVLDIPDAQMAQVGASLAQQDSISLCYQRPRSLPDWPYNLFCMIKGDGRENIQQSIVDLLQRLELSACAYDLLFSVSPIKKNGLAPA
ncbi:MAG: Lrp/AsnC family transcriptional regulator [Betaproteobacteria bacterium]